MLHSADKLRGCRLEAVDGEVGKVTDLFFDDVSWLLRYFVVNTGNWLASRNVLISPNAVTNFDFETGRLVTALTREQVEQSPPIEMHEPLSRQYETRLASYYGWAPYWNYGLTPGAGAYTFPITGGDFPYPTGAAPFTPSPETLEMEEILARKREGADPHLRSAKEVEGYHILAEDGEIGHIKNFLIQSDGWKINHIIADTHNWLPGRKVVIDIGWVKSVDWGERQVAVDLSRDEMRHSPEFDKDHYLDSDYETTIDTYYSKLAKNRLKRPSNGPQHTSEAPIS